MMYDWLGTLGNVAAILTAGFAGGASLWYLVQRSRRRSKLQSYLIKERKDAESRGGKGIGARSIIHLMGNCSMTEAQVLEAAFGNESIRTWVTADEESKRATGLMFQINDEAWKRLKKSN